MHRQALEVGLQIKIPGSINMKEEFLHFIWQFQYFDKTLLMTQEGKILQILRPGSLNTGPGADFQLAKIVLDGAEWTGSVEIHLKSSDWNAHKHQHDAYYNNVVLHVVWEHDKEIYRADGTALPALELKNRVKLSLLGQYKNLMQSKSDPPCEAHFKQVNLLTKRSMIDKALIQRLEKKAEGLKSLWQDCEHDWEETAYRALAKNFGFKTNAEPFLALARGLPLKYIRKHSDQLFQLEALIFGQAGWLDEEDGADDYRRALQQEYRFLSQKYGLGLQKLSPEVWIFGKTRPPGFPTVRLSQWAALLHQQTHFFSLLLNTEALKELYTAFGAPPSQYWQTHYHFGKVGKQAFGALGKSAADNLIINTLVPLLVLYSKEKDLPDFLDKALHYLEKLPPEQNKILDLWSRSDFKAENAFDSQGLIELYNDFCTAKRCLACTIGNQIIKQNP